MALAYKSRLWRIRNRLIFEALARIGKYLYLQESDGVRFDFLQIDRNVLS
jgi:hypothetical protein